MATWILLRGLTRESRHWGRFIAQFQHALPFARIVALDLPGNGLLNQERSPMRVQDMVAHCRAQLALRQIEPPYHLLAMSLGAMVAVNWCQAHAHEVAANVLINTSMRPFNPFYQRLQPANYRKLLTLAVVSAEPERWEHTVLRLTSNHANEAVLPYWLALRHENPVSRVNALRQLIAAARFRVQLDRSLAPTLVLASEQDHLVRVECSRALARQWQCALRIHPSAGHDLPLDDGPWVAARVRDWLTHACNEWT